MSLYWAKFERDDSGRTFRLDTRVYLTDVAKCSTKDPLIGAVVAKNPGSAQPSGSARLLQPIQLANDKLIPTVRSIVMKAYEEADCKSARRGYIQVLNLFYLCDNKYTQALREMSHISKPPTDPAEDRCFPWVFYLWGEYDQHKAPYIDRFTDLNADAHFYFDKLRDVVVSGVPGKTSFAKHTQGLVQEPVIDHLAQLLNSQNQRRT